MLAVQLAFSLKNVALRWVTLQRCTTTMDALPRATCRKRGYRMLRSP